MTIYYTIKCYMLLFIQHMKFTPHKVSYVCLCKNSLVHHKFRAVVLVCWGHLLLEARGVKQELCSVGSEQSAAEPLDKASLPIVCVCRMQGK